MTPSHNACRVLSACILFHTLNIQWRHCNYSLLIPTLPNLPVRVKPGCLFPPLHTDFRAQAAPSCHWAKTPLSLSFFFFLPKYCELSSKDLLIALTQIPRPALAGCMHHQQSLSITGMEQVVYPGKAKDLKEILSGIMYKGNTFICVINCGKCGHRGLNLT